MSRGIFFNLYEINPPSKLALLCRPWTPEIDTKKLRRDLLPAFLFASDHTLQLYCYGPASQKSEQFGFTLADVESSVDPRLTGRFLLDALVYRLIRQSNFDLHFRPHMAKVYEVTDYNSKIMEVERRIDVYQSYKIQTVFLRIAGELKYFLLVRPKSRYQFRHAIAEVYKSVDITGRYIRLSCPAECQVYDCPLYDHRHNLAGQFVGVTQNGEFICKHLNTGGAGKNAVQFSSDSRFDFAIPVEVCELEASVANISAIFAKRFDSARSSKVISDLRIATGDLLPSSPRAMINTQVGQRRYTEIESLLTKISGEQTAFSGEVFSISSDPIQALEGGFAPDDSFFEDDTLDGHEAEQYDDTF